MLINWGEGEKAMARKLCLLIAVLFLFSCAQMEIMSAKYDRQKFMDNYDKMFSSAINKGTQMSYKIDSQDKEYGIVKMSRKAGYSTFTITVDFGEDDFIVTGEVDTDLFNIFISKDAEAIENAIKKAAE
jgi:hypothetical protein